MKIKYFALVCILAITPVLAQNVISAKAGLVNLVEGEVFLNDARLAPKLTEFPEIKQDMILRTGEGRAEVLLSPGSYIRLGEGASMKMLSTLLTDVRLEMLSGSAILEVAEIGKETPITVLAGGASVEVKKAGLYRIDNDPVSVRTYEGEMLVRNGEQIFTLKAGRMLNALNGQWAVQRFDPELGDELYRWARRRAAALAAANISAARMARVGDLRNGYLPGYGGWYGMSIPLGYGFRGSWMYNPFFGGWTYVPFNGTYYSPWGYGYWSPVTVTQVYVPSVSGGGASYTRGPVNTRSMETRSFSPSYNPGLGYQTTGSRSWGAAYSGPAFSSGSMGGGGGGVAASAPASGGSIGGGAARGGGDAGARGGSGGGRGN